MSEEAAPSFSNEVANAATGLTRLIGYREDWHQSFDFSAQGFVRSFLAQAAALPFYLVTAGMVSRMQGASNGLATISAAGLAHILDVLAFPVLIAVLARPLRLQAFSAFFVVINWGSLILNVVLAVASMLVLLGREGFALFSTVFLAAFGLSIFLTWRAARECLTQELPAGLLVVVLSVAVGVGVDQAAAWVVRLFL